MRRERQELETTCRRSCDDAGDLMRRAERPTPPPSAEPSAQAAHSFAPAAWTMVTAMMTDRASRRHGARPARYGFALLIAGCAAPSALAKAQEAAQELNVNARYGRNDIAIERVAPQAREQFTAHHRAWGSGVRVADIELEGSRAKGDRDVEMMVRVAWYRPEEEDLRSTTLKQSWHDQNGWHLVSEERLEGDLGLLGETVVFQSPTEPRPPTQFPTVKLGSPAP